VRAWWAGRRSYPDRTHRRGGIRSPTCDVRPRVAAMKKLLVLIVVVALAAFAVKKLQDA
jgi:hypothetical protein